MDPNPSHTPYPVNLTFEAPHEVANWRPLVHWILAVPHYLVLWFLGIARNVLTVIAFFAILFTKTYPRGLFDFTVLTFRYQWRVSTYILFMRESYPEFTFDGGPEDTSADPAKLSIAYQEEYARFMPLIKWLLVLPHAIALMFVAIGAIFIWIGSFFAVLFTGKYPDGMRSYMVGMSRWMNRVMAYFCLLTDEYPPFSMQE